MGSRRPRPGIVELYTRSESSFFGRGGDLDGALQRVADENEKDVDRETKVVMTLLGPAMIIIVGLIVGFIVMAMLLPIFSLGDSIQI